MGINSTVLCIQHESAQLPLLRDNGYRVLTATNGHDGLRLCLAQPVDAVVLEYHLRFLDGGVVASAIKKACPRVPIVMLIDHLDVPDGALTSVDMVVAKIDGDHFLLSAVNSVLADKPQMESDQSPRITRTLPGNRASSKSADLESNVHDTPFSGEEWRSILDGTVKFRSDA